MIYCKPLIFKRLCIQQWQENKWVNSIFVWSFSLQLETKKVNNLFCEITTSFCMMWSLGATVRSPTWWSWRTDSSPETAIATQGKDCVYYRPPQSPLSCRSLVYWVPLLVFVSTILSKSNNIICYNNNWSGYLCGYRNTC